MEDIWLYTYHALELINYLFKEILSFIKSVLIFTWSVKMKKIHLNIIISAIFICIPNLILANCGGLLISLENKDSYLNCRSGPGKNHEVLKKLPHGLPIFVKYQVYNDKNTPWIFLTEGCFVIDRRLTNKKL